MNKKKVRLICRSVCYFSQDDENLFFEWLRRIPSMVEMEGWGDELHLFIKSNRIPGNDLRELIAIFYRYEIKDMTQLKVFLNKSNKNWFFDNPHAFWHERVFAEPRIKLICDDATFNEGSESEDWFEKDVARIPSVDELDYFGSKLHVYVKSTNIPDADLESLILLFHRYQVKDMSQLKVFLNEKNKEWFFDDKEAYWHKAVFGKQNKKTKNPS